MRLKYKSYVVVGTDTDAKYEKLKADGWRLLDAHDLMCSSGPGNALECLRVMTWVKRRTRKRRPT